MIDLETQQQSNFAYQTFDLQPKGFQVKMKRMCSQVGACCAITSMLGVADIATGGVLWAGSYNTAISDDVIGPILVGSGICMFSCSIGYVIGGICGCCKDLTKQTQSHRSWQQPYQDEI